MNIKIRFLVALALFAAIVIAGLGAPAWADKLDLGARSPAAGGLQSNLPVGSRPQGTVPIGGEVVTLTSDVIATVGSCATVLVKSAPAGVVYTASVVPQDVLPRELPGKLISCAIKVEAQPGATLGAEVEVCFPIPPSTTGFAHEHDGTQWATSTVAATGGQACVAVPAIAGTPSFAALFDK